MKFIFILIVMLFSSLNTVKGNSNFWHLQNDNNVWWLVDPDQNKTFFLGVTSIRPEQFGLTEPHYLSKNYNEENKEEWAKKTSEQIKEIGFTGSGAWSDPAIHKYLPYTKDLNLTKYSSRNISDPLWEQDIEKAIILQVTPNDKNLIGYYTDNELDWESLEKDASKYFTTVNNLLKKHDPNHLNLGVRFNHRPPISVIRASIGKTDVHSINCYNDNAIIWKNMFKEIYEITKVPIIISEFSFFSIENNSNNPNLFIETGIRHFGGIASTQNNRAELYKAFMETALSCSFIIGTEWFQWNDEPPSGRRSDSESFNFGVVDINDNPYPQLTKAIKDISQDAYNFHAKSTNKQQGFTWADDPIRLK